MKKIIALIVTILFYNAISLAQNDSIPKEEKIRKEIYDVVGVYDSHIDSRGKKRTFVYEEKGEILSFDESTGVITLKGKDGKMYSFAREEYKYFEYNKEFTIKPKKKKVIKPRKGKNELEYSVGLSATAGGFDSKYTTTDELGNTDDQYFYVNYATVSLKLGGGIYINPSVYFGLTTEIAGKSYYNFGTRFFGQYGGKKSNILFYTPVELKYNKISDNTEFTLYNTEGNTYEIDNKTNMSYISIDIGQGISFALANKQSLKIEILAEKTFATAYELENEENYTPDLDDFQSNINLKLALLYNF